MLLELCISSVSHIFYVSLKSRPHISLETAMNHRVSKLFWLWIFVLFNTGKFALQYYYKEIYLGSTTATIDIIYLFGKDG